MCRKNRLGFAHCEPLPERPSHRQRLPPEGARGEVWRAKVRLPDGRQLHRRIGPAWTARGRPAAGTYTKRGAEGVLREWLRQADEGTLPGKMGSASGRG